MTEVSGTLFDGSASDKEMRSTDQFMSDFASKKQLLDSKRSGLVETLPSPKAGTKNPANQRTKPPGPTQCKKPIMTSEQVTYEKSGFLAASEKVAAKVNNIANSCEFRNAKDVLKGIAQYKNLAAVGENRIKSAMVGLSTALPFQLSQACQNIVDNFAKRVAPRSKGYDRITPTGSRFVQSDQVECAMDALEMLTGVKGLKGKIKNTLVDIEATAAVLAGMVTTLIDYDMLDDIEAVLGTSSSTRAVRRAIGLSSATIVATGNMSLINWMLDRIGVLETVSYNPRLTGDIIGSYEKLEPGDDQYFIDTLNRVDPEWSNKDDVYYFDVIRDGSPSARNAFEQYDAFRTLDIASETVFFDGPVVRDPTVAEVTRNTYPEATGQNRQSNRSWLFQTVTGINPSNPLYFFR